MADMLYRHFIHEPRTRLRDVLRWRPEVNMREYSRQTTRLGGMEILATGLLLLLILAALLP